MKKNQTILTGIVLLISLLIAFGCRSKEKEEEKEEAIEIEQDIVIEEISEANVTIFLKAAVERKDKRKHLEMYNSYSPDSLVVDSLITGVNSGNIIIWDRKPGNGIKRVIHVRPVLENGILMPEAAKEVLFTDKKVFMIRIPDISTDSVIIEKYEIVFEDDDNNTWCIDPYLRIPPPDDRQDIGGR